MNEQTKQITFDIPEGYDIDIEHSDLKNRVIKFKTEELRDQFLENFDSLIEKAKPLI